jgi:signal transduction histidine kinase/CheY-like chemotaxis protein
MAAGLAAFAAVGAPLSASGGRDTATQIGAMIQAARSQMLVEPGASLETAKKSAELAQKTLNGPARERYIAEAEGVQGQALIRLGQLDAAAATVRSAITRAGKSAVSPKVFGDLLLSLGQIETRQNDVQGALSDFQRAYKLFQQARETRWQAIALQSIGQLYIRGGDSESALKYYAQASDAYQGDPLFSLSNRNNRGNALLELSRPAEAEHEFRLALGDAQKIDSAKYMASVLGNLAQAQVNQGKFDEARVAIARAFVAVGHEAGDSDTWWLWEIRAQIAFQRKDLKGAIRAIELALEGVDPKTSTSTYRQAHETAYQIYRAAGMDQRALVHLEAKSRIDYANAKLTASASAALMAARFDFANQDLKISQLKAAQLEKSVAFERARATLQRNLLITIMIGSILIGSLLMVGLILITRSRNRERAAKLVLADTNIELEKAIAAKMEFLATTSHEIRTPLNGILGMTQVMLSDRKLDATLRDRIGIVHSAGENMRTLVDDILDVAKMETGKLAVGVGTIELKATLRQVAQVWRLQAEAAGIALVLRLDDCPERVEGDAGRLRQIVFNLLSNAMKFTEKGKVELSAEANANRLRISIRDSGIGIAREWHESIFELFQQVDGGTTRQYGGTGLGLAICRNLARAMGGDVSVESEPGFGSTFTLDLPLVVVDGQSVSNAGAHNSSTVLVIERNPLTRGIMRAVLSERFDVVTFVSCDSEAADALAHGGVDCIVVDASSVESWDALDGSIPTVLIEGTATAPGSLHGSMRAVLTKPVSKSALLAALADIGAPVAVAA